MTADAWTSIERSESVPASWRNPPVVPSFVSGVLLLFGFVVGQLGVGATAQTIIYSPRSTSRICRLRAIRWC